jgi:hypothetical protein
MIVSAVLLISRCATRCCNLSDSFGLVGIFFLYLVNQKTYVVWNVVKLLFKENCFCRYNHACISQIFIIELVDSIVSVEF